MTRAPSKCSANPPSLTGSTHYYRIND